MSPQNEFWFVDVLSIFNWQSFDGQSIKFWNLDEVRISKWVGYIKRFKNGG